MRRSVEIWNKMIAILEPTRIVTVGKKASEVMPKAAAHVPCVRWASASPVFLNRVAGLFDSTDLLSRFPTVASAAAANAGWLELYGDCKIFYACHAVSIAAANASKAP